MDATIDLRYEQLLAAVKKLPTAQMEQLRSVLNQELIAAETTQDVTEFTTFLLTAPVMSQEQYKEHKSNRKYFSKWRTK